MNKLFLASAVAIASVAVAPAASQAAEQPVFTDVPESHQFYKEITDLAAKGVISGYDNGTFLPNNEVTRAQAAKIIAVTLGLAITTVKDPNFSDVKTSAWYYPYVAVLAEKGIIQGFEGSYSPNAPLTRAQMAIILTRAYELELATELTHPFVDVKADSHYSYYVQTLLNYDITKGNTATTYSPGSYVKRGQLAAFVTRAQALQAPVLPEEKPETPVNPDEEVTEKPAVPTTPETPTAPEGPVEGTTPPVEKETLSVEAILQNHQGAFSGLEASGRATVSGLVSAAQAELATLIAAGEKDAISILLPKYAAQAAAAEASLDALFNTLYSAVVAELTANGHSASHADGFRLSYESAKASARESVLSQF